MEKILDGLLRTVHEGNEMGYRLETHLVQFDRASIQPRGVIACSPDINAFKLRRLAV